MNILACETSTLIGSVAIYSHGYIVERRIQRAGSHSETLNLMIEECLSESNLSLKDIDLFASGVGPGSFTGVRVSLNTIKTYAYAMNKQCVGFDSLRNLAELNIRLNKNLLLQLHGDRITLSPIINAYKNMVYFAEYEIVKKESQNFDIKVIKVPQVVRVQDLKLILKKNSIIVGDGYLDYQNYIVKDCSELIVRLPESIDHPLASEICNVIIESRRRSSRGIQLLPVQFSELIPLYLRDSEAEENLKGIKYIPIENS